MVGAPARRELVRWRKEKILTERRALDVMGMSAASFRYQPAPDQNAAVRERIRALAHRHRRYGSGMVALKLRQEGLTCLPIFGLPDTLSTPAKNVHFPLV